MTRHGAYRKIGAVRATAIEGTGSALRGVVLAAILVTLPSLTAARADTLGERDTRDAVKEMARGNRSHRAALCDRLRTSGNVAWSMVTALECVGVMEDRLDDAITARDRQGDKMYGYFLRRVAKSSSSRSEFTEFRAMEIENRDLCGTVEEMWEGLQGVQSTARTIAGELVERDDVLAPVAERVRVIVKRSRRAPRRGAVLRSLAGHLVRALAEDLNEWAAEIDEREVSVPAMRLLTHIPDTVDVARLAPAAAHADPVVRRTAFRLLATVGSADAVEVLISRVDQEEGVPARDLLWYLRELSGQSERTTPTEWRQWWEAFRPGWARAAGEVAAVGSVEPPAYSRYFGLELRSARVLFVIDRSGSMSYWVGFHDGLDDSAAYREPDKMSIAVRELLQAVGGLDERVSFNILSYGDEFDAFESRPVRATETRREKATRWVERLKPGGVTNLSGTLIEAMANTRPGKGAEDASIADTIVVLSDGVPNCGPIAYAEDTLAELRRLNADRMVTIHAVFLGVDGDESFMRTLAEDHGGKFVHYRR